MSFEKFKFNFFSNLKKNNKECICEIEENKDLIKEYLSETENLSNNNIFVEEINNIILQNKDNFNLIEEIFKYKYFERIYSAFRNSEVLIEACKVENINAIKWLLSMNINSCVQNGDGISALMYASKSPSLVFVVEHFISDISCLNLLDKNDENALFYSLENRNSLEILLKSEININQVNKNGDTPILFCCKNDIFDVIPILTNRKDIDVNLTDNTERTSAMYLGAKGRKVEFMALNKRDCNYNFINKNKESVLSSIINNMYSTNENKCTNIFSSYIGMLIAMVHFRCDFNYPIDEVENTAIMAFIIVRDFYMLLYTLKYSNTVDLSIKNKYGENASSLFFKYFNSKPIFNIIKVHPTLDFEYIDNHNHNTLLMICSITQPKLIDTIMEKNPTCINKVNQKKENALIIATKFRCQKSIKKLLKYNININHQDNEGNTALYYAVELKDISIIKLLLHYKADVTIKNNKGISILDYANTLEDKEISNTLLQLLSDNSRSSSSSTSTISSISKSKEKFVKIFEKDKSLNNDLNINYKDMSEYLYPYIGDHFSKFKMTKGKIGLEKEIFKEYFSNMELKYLIELYDPVKGFNYLKCLQSITQAIFDFTF